MSATIDDTVLCRLAGELWAVFAPWHGPWGGGGAAAVYLARRSFRSGAGLRWRHSGRDRDERDENVEALGRLERRGLLTRRVERTKVVAVRLLDAGIERACGLTGAPGWRDGWEVCCQLATRQEMFKELRKAISEALKLPVGESDEYLHWTAEWALAGTPPNWAECGDDEIGLANRRLLADLEVRTIPALVRGWMESGSDLHSRVSYSLTDAGRAALTGPPPERLSLADVAASCAVAWLEGAHAMRVRLASAPRSEREIGLLPLSAHDAEPYTYATARQEYRDYAKSAAAAAHLAKGPIVGDDVGPRGDVPTAGERNYAASAHLATGANVGGDLAAPGAADSRPRRPSTRTRRTDS